MIEFAKLLLALRYGRVPFNLEHVKQNCSSCAVDNESRLFPSQRRRSMGLCFSYESSCAEEGAGLVTASPLKAYSLADSSRTFVMHFKSSFARSGNQNPQ